MKSFDADIAMLIYLEVLIEMAFILLPVMAIAMVAGSGGKFISIWFFIYNRTIKIRFEEN